MKIKDLLIVSLILAVLTIGAVSASEDISDDLTASDITEDPIEEISDDIITDEGNDEPLELQESDFKVNITEKINLDDKNVDKSDVVSIYCPKESEGGNIKILYSKYNYTLNYGIDSEIAGSVFTVKASEFYFSRGDYPISVYYTNASDELLLKSTTINMTKTLTADEFDIATDGVDLESYVVAIWYYPLPGTLIVDVDGIERFSKQVVSGGYTYVYYKDLNITCAGNYNIKVKFKSDDGDELVLREFKASLSEFIVSTFYNPKLNKDLFSIRSIAANGTVLIYVDGIQSYSRNVTVGDENFKVNSKDLNISTSGKYNIQFKFKYANGVEKEIYSNTINVILFEYYYNNHAYLSNTYCIFSLYGFAVNGTVEVYVDGVRRYNKSVNSDQYLYQYLDIYPNDLNITATGDYNITLKFISDNETKIYNVTIKMEMFSFYSPTVELLSSSIFRAYNFPFNGTLTIYVDGIQRYSKEVYKNNNLDIYCTDLNITTPGKYTILVKYKPENGEENEITCYNTTLKMAYISDYKSVSSLNVTGILLSAYSFVSDGNLIIDVDDVQRYSKEVKANGHISIEATDLNINTCDIFKIVVKFITKDGEESILITYYLTTYFEDDMIHIQPSDIPIGKKKALVDLNTKSEDYLNGTVTISIDGKLIYTKTINDSDNLTRLMVYTDELDLSNLKYDEYKISAIFMKNGVEKHVSEKFVKFIPNVVIYCPEYFIFGEKEAIYIYAPKGLNGNAVLYEIYYYDHDSYNHNMIDNVTIVDGFARIPLDNLSGGYDDLFLIYKLANLDGSDSFHKIKVINNTPGYSSTISAKEITVGESVLVTLSGNASFKNADIFVDGIKQFSFPFNLGEMMYSVENLTVGDHYITVKYADDSEDIKYSQTYQVTVKNKEVSPVIIKPVKKDTVKLTLKKVKVKKSAKKLVISATLKINGKVAKNKKVTFKFNGKKYTARTDKKGVAKLTVKKNVLKKLKAGKKVAYQVTYDKVTKKISVKVKK